MDEFDQEDMDFVSGTFDGAIEQLEEAQLNAADRHTANVVAEKINNVRAKLRRLVPGWVE